MSARPRARAVTPLFVVAELQRSIDFYTKQLGYSDAVVHGDPPCFAMMQRDGFELMLSVACPTTTGRPNGGDGTWDMSIVVADIDAEIAALTAAGVRIDKGPRETFYQMREIEILDPDGHRLCIAQDTSGAPLAGAQAFEGTLDLGTVKLRLVLEIVPSGSEWVGRLDSPDQGASNVPIDEVTRTGRALRFVMRAIDARFEGTLSEDERELVGSWSQRGKTWPLEFRRA